MNLNTFTEELNLSGIVTSLVNLTDFENVLQIITLLHRRFYKYLYDLLLILESSLLLMSMSSKSHINSIACLISYFSERQSLVFAEVSSVRGAIASNNRKLCSLICAFVQSTARDLSHRPVRHTQYQ